MEAFQYFINILTVIAAIISVVAIAYYMARTAFDWKKVGYLTSFIFLSGFIWYYFSKLHYDPFTVQRLQCITYGPSVWDCNGWLITHEKAYEWANSFKGWLANSALARAQAIIAGLVTVVIALLQYSKAALKKPSALIGFGLTVFGTYLFLNNLSEIQTLLNSFFSYVISFGLFDQKSSYIKLADSFAALTAIEEKYTIFDKLKSGFSLKAWFGSNAGFLLKFLYSQLSWLNLLMLIYQALCIAFLPSILAFSLITSDFDIRKPLRIVGYSVLARIFVVVQIFSIEMLDVQYSFEDLMENSGTVFFSFFIAFAGTLISLLVLGFAMLRYGSKALLSELITIRSAGDAR